MTDNILKILKEGKPTEVIALFKFTRETDTDEILKKFNIWGRWFFPKFFRSKDAKFHGEMDRRRIDLYKNGGAFLNIAFRGAAKTTRNRVLKAFFIANDSGHYRKYFKNLSKELDNAKQATTDVYNLLVSPRIKAYYPEIFAKTETKREERMESFTTATGIKMTADSVGTDQRGDVQEESRPDYIDMDDFETRMSLMSAITTHKIWGNMEEARTGLAKGGAIEYNCNYISEMGNVHKLFLKIKNKMLTPLVDDEGNITWPNRYSQGDVEAIKRDMDDYEGEYLNKPEASRDVYFDRESIDKQVSKKPIQEIAGLKIFRKYDPSHRVGSGHDVGKGVGLDSSTSVFMDFDVIPIQVIATYKNNEIDPKTFAYEIKRQAEHFGNNYVAVENNYGSTNDFLVDIYPKNKIHKTQKSNAKIILQKPTEYGWNTNGVTKPKMMADFARAIESGKVELNDEDLRAEARSYTRNDLIDKEPDSRLTTRHFDLLMAAAICYQLNPFIPVIGRDEQYPSPWPQKSSNPAR